MTTRRKKVNVDLDANIIERMRAERGVGAESEAAVIEDALNAYPARSTGARRR